MYRKQDIILIITFVYIMDSKGIKPVNAWGNKLWIFIGRTQAKAETPMLWPHDARRWLIGKDPDAGKDWRQEEKGMTKDEMVGWHHQLNGYEFEQTLADGEGQGSLGCCSPWGHKELDTKEQLNNKKIINCDTSTFFFLLLSCLNLGWNILYNISTIII